MHTKKRVHARMDCQSCGRNLAAYLIGRCKCGRMVCPNCWQNGCQQCGYIRVTPRPAESLGEEEGL